MATEAIGNQARNCGIMAVLAFAIVMAIYVSIPDYPYNAPPWAVQLWSEPSGWWSEMTWLAGFAVSAILGLYVLSWLKWTRTVGYSVDCVLCSWLAFTFAFVYAYRAYLPQTFDDVILDRGGVLHGIFYVWTTHLTVIALVLWLAYGAQIKKEINHGN